MTTGNHDNEREMPVGYAEQHPDPNFHSEQLSAPVAEQQETILTPEAAKKEVGNLVDAFVSTTPGLVDAAVSSVVGQPPKTEDIPLVGAAARESKLEETLTAITTEAETVRIEALADIDTMSHSDAMRQLEQQHQKAVSKADRTAIEAKMADIDAKHGFVVPVESFSSKPKPAPESTYERMKNLEAKLKSGTLFPEERQRIEHELNMLDAHKAPEIPFIRKSPEPDRVSTPETASSSQKVLADSATEQEHPIQQQNTEGDDKKEGAPVPEKQSPTPGAAKTETINPQAELVKAAKEEVARLRATLAKMSKADVESGAAKDLETQYYQAINAYGKAQYALDKDSLRQTFDRRAELARDAIKDPKMDKNEKLDLRFYEPRYETLLNQVEILKKTEEALSKNADTKPEDLEKVRRELEAASAKIDNELRLDAQAGYILAERQAFLDAKSVETEAGKSKNRKRLEKIWAAYQKQPRWKKLAISTGISAALGFGFGGAALGVGAWAAARAGGMVGGMVGGRVGGWLGGLAGNQLNKSSRQEAAVATALQNASLRNEDLGSAFKSSLDSYEAQAKADRIRQRARIAGTILGAGLAGWGGGQAVHGMTHHETVSGNDPSPRPSSDSIKVETQTTASSITETKILAQESMFGSRGAIGGFDDLQEKLKLQFGEDPMKWGGLPENVKHLLETDPHTLAQEYGMYDPNSTAESAMVMKGDSLMLDENGHLLLKDHTGTVQDLTVVGKANVRMFDYETTFGKPRANLADARMESHAGATDNQLLSQEQRLNARYHMSEVASERATAGMNAQLRTPDGSDASLTMDQMNTMKANADDLFTGNVDGNQHAYSLGDTNVKFLAGPDGKAMAIQSLDIGPNQDTNIDDYLGKDWENDVHRSGRLFGPGIKKQIRVIEDAMKRIDSVTTLADRFPAGSTERLLLINQSKSLLGDIVRQYSWNADLLGRALRVINKP